MARFSFRRPKIRTIYRNVITRRPRFRRPKKKTTYLYLGLALAGVAGFVYKDKIKELLAKK